MMSASPEIPPALCLLCGSAGTRSQTVRMTRISGRIPLTVLDKPFSFLVFKYQQLPLESETI